MEALISQFTFLSDKALLDKDYDPFTIEDLMKLFEIESYKAWVAVELEQEKEVEAEITMQQAEDHFDWVMDNSLDDDDDDEFGHFEEELERMSKAETEMRYSEGAASSAIASSKVHSS
ncbi:hypothetical protein RJT34_03438 [Clitoria ternatea]|uniref:Uncharacterized protein n=1 Tax=Clitoria ternatea TaxID=43366 RepID=A0AAN9KLN2_CLITE